jgi:hypothetical protein
MGRKIVDELVQQKLFDRQWGRHVLKWALVPVGRRLEKCMLTNRRRLEVEMLVSWR